MKKVLLLFDQKKVSEEIFSLLQLEGFNVVTAENVSFNKSIIGTENPDVVIVDTFRGESAVKEILKSYPDVTVICWLLERNAKIAVDLMQAGVIDCLHPPLRAAEVIGVVRHALGQNENPKAGTQFILPFASLLAYKKYIAAGLGVLFLFFAWKTVVSMTQVMRLELPNKNPIGIACKDGGLWIGDWYTQSIYAYTLKKNLVLHDSYYFSNFGPLALTIGESFLWSAGNDLTLRKHLLNERLEVVQRYELKEHSPSGMAVIGEHLWLSDSSKKQLFKYMIDRELILTDTYDIPLSLPVGLSWDAEHLWIADAESEKVYLYKPTGNTIRIRKIFQLPHYEDGQLAGIYPYKKWVFAIYAANPSRLFRYKISALEVLK